MTGSQPPAARGRVRGQELAGTGHRARGLALLLAGILLIAITMRAPLTVVGPLLGIIRSQFRLSGSAAGLLNALPLLAFAAFSPLAPRLARRTGTERALLLAVTVLAAGVVLRSLPWTAALFGGTLALGAAIAVANTLLPALVKQHFPGRQGTLTGVYVATMGLGAAVASGVAVPIAGTVPGGWQTALGCWAVLAVPAAAIWLPQLPRAGRGSDPASAAAGPPPAPRMPWRSALAWQVTLYMGLQSLGFYVIVGWLPSLLRSHGISAHAAGWMLSLYQIVNLVASLTVPLLIDRMAGQRALACAAALCVAAGYVGLIVAPGSAVVWVIVAGIGTGSCFVLALSFMALRAPGPRQTAALSAMAQSIGYLVAAGGPVAFGFLHDASGSWTPSLVMLLGTAILLAAAGLGAGRPVHVRGDR